MLQFLPQKGINEVEKTYNGQLVKKIRFIGKEEAAITDQKTDIQTQLLQETRQKLFGRNVSARGSIMSVHDELSFFPMQIQFS